jgi:hypothetical protein
MAVREAFLFMCTTRNPQTSWVKSSQVPSFTAGFRSTIDRLPSGCLLFM